MKWWYPLSTMGQPHLLCPYLKLLFIAPLFTCQYLAILLSDHKLPLPIPTSMHSSDKNVAILISSILFPLVFYRATKSFFHIFFTQFFDNTVEYSDLSLPLKCRIMLAIGTLQLKSIFTQSLSPTGTTFPPLSYLGFKGWYTISRLEHLAIIMDALKL